MTENGTILVTGATGYVGARLVTRLLAKGTGCAPPAVPLGACEASCANQPGVELFRPTPGPRIDREGVRRVRGGVLPRPFHDAGGGEFERKDREAAQNMRRAATETGSRA